jgi:hypothetical protein
MTQVVRRSGHHYEIRVEVADPVTPEILTWLDGVLA